MESPQGTTVEVDEALAEILKAHKYKVVQRDAATSDKHTGAAVVEPPVDLPEPPAEDAAETSDDTVEPPAAETAAAPTAAKRGKK
ncbi:hypothetical protein [Canibacter oris]|uniref:Uncharacterized protein n=1 Tax=Canibacter oris TaxID=1365628 RepID=A0A840DDU5_9MICO|nr:hypothetical protein [Canibacter oris]MBB4071621.1 hypothetical protein [Canibacter oris]